MLFGHCKITKSWGKDSGLAPYFWGIYTSSHFYRTAIIRKIDEIIRTLDDLWFFLCRDSTGNYKMLIENDAALLIEELKKTLPKVETNIDEKFVPSGETQPTMIRKTTQNGEKSVYVENNMGSIIIN